MHRRGERRRFVRVADEMIAAIAERGVDDAPRVRTLNFSLGGVLLASDHRIEPGTDVDVSLRVEENGTERLLEFEARVVRVRSLSDRYHELAVEFVGGSAGDQQSLQALIADRLTPDPYTPRTA